MRGVYRSSISGLRPDFLEKIPLIVTVYFGCTYTCAGPVPPQRNDNGWGALQLQHTSLSAAGDAAMSAGKISRDMQNLAIKLRQCLIEHSVPGEGRVK